MIETIEQEIYHPFAAMKLDAKEKVNLNEETKKQMIL